MKKKIFGGIALMAIAAAVAFNVSLNLNKSNNQLSQLALANVEALAGDEGVLQCDILKYNRNYMEAWELKTATAQIKADLSFTVYGKKYELAAASIQVGCSIKYPYCKASDGNCCLKTHVDKAVIYL